jgi:hypothetical protein
LTLTGISSPSLPRRPGPTAMTTPSLTCDIDQGME